jgi:hypothetical protein
MAITDISALPLLALYAETHFRFFKLFPNLLYANQPEIIFDAPARIDPGQDLPVILVVNDCHRFPAELSDCAIAVSQHGGKPVKFDFADINNCEVDNPLRNTQKAFLFVIPRDRVPAGRVFITATIKARCNRKEFRIINDNLRTGSKLSFSCFVSADHLPGSEFCSYGDLHTHSHYSQSHVEFGPPLRIIDKIAKASGLSFTAITDHSYDLACSIDDYLDHDPSLKRWQTFQKEINNNSYDTCLIPGEEISCLNTIGEVVHLCGLNLRKFITGTLDGARKNRTKMPQLTTTEAIEAIHEQNGIAFAAHPGSQPGFWQKVFLQRGEWTIKDATSNLDGMQVYNSGFGAPFDIGMSLWKKMLQAGCKVPILAGNDGHGDFNRYRALAVPFISIKDNPDRYFGRGKTGIYGSCRSVADVMNRIRTGATFITTGPFVSISASPVVGDSSISNEPLSGDITALTVHGISTPEFGALKSMTVYAGEPGASSEKPVLSQLYDQPVFKTTERFDITSLRKQLIYLRAEITTTTSARALTSPIYF